MRAPPLAAEADQRAPVLDAVRDAADEPLADDGAHGARDEAKLEGGGHDRHALQRSGHDNERVALVGVALRLVQPFAVTFRVFETQRIERLEIPRELVAGVGIEEHLETLARADPQMVVAFRADMEIAMELGAVELGGAS